MLDRDHLGVLDLVTRRNAFGRQVRSFETDLQLDGLEGGPFRAVFIRAPWVERCGRDVDVLAEVDGHPVAVRKHDLLAVAFHPELTSDDRLHRWLVDAVAARRVEEPAA
jgi:5'-phosphate synthase pdxT subunit